MKTILTLLKGFLIFGHKIYFSAFKMCKLAKEEGKLLVIKW